MMKGLTFTVCEDIRDEYDVYHTHPAPGVIYVPALR